MKFQHLALDDRDAAAHKSRRGTQVSTRCLMSSHLMAVIWASRPPSRAAQPGLHSRRLCVGIGDLRVVAAVEWADAPGVTLAIVHVQGGIEPAAACPRRDESGGGGGVLVELRGEGVEGSQVARHRQLEECCSSSATDAAAFAMIDAHTHRHSQTHHVSAVASAGIVGQVGVARAESAQSSVTEAGAVAADGHIGVRPGIDGGADVRAPAQGASHWR